MIDRKTLNLLFHQVFNLKVKKKLLKTQESFPESSIDNMKELDLDKRLNLDLIIIRLKNFEQFHHLVQSRLPNKLTVGDMVNKMRSTKTVMGIICSNTVIEEEGKCDDIELFTKKNHGNVF